MTKDLIGSQAVEVPFDEEVLLRNRAWDATVEGRYEEALRIYAQELPPVLARYVERPPLLGHLNTVAVLHLLRGDLDHALTLFRQGRDLPGPSAIPQPFVGCVLWQRGERDAACEDWAFEIVRRRSGVITHCDEAGGVTVPALLWWASAHEGLGQWRKIAVQELRQRGRTQKCQRSRWPGPLVPFLLGRGSANEMSEAQLMERVGDTQYPNINFRHHCLAHFYLGASLLDVGDTAGYREHLKRVVASLPSGLRELRLSNPEYHLAHNALVSVGRSL